MENPVLYDGPNRLSDMIKVFNTLGSLSALARDAAFDKIHPHLDCIGGAVLTALPKYRGILFATEADEEMIHQILDDEYEGHFAHGVDLGAQPITFDLAYASLKKMPDLVAFLHVVFSCNSENILKEGGILATGRGICPRCLTRTELSPSKVPPGSKKLAGLLFAGSRS
ncbi:hypothetical protein Sste5346_006035 [Sporothrix stenoceras]|uniref:Uncharacterized protein n=1 Tax=Sporothrix stenoceras TaxID=5173 RepID=A0ABR3Z0U3_9PEZI